MSGSIKDRAPNRPQYYSTVPISQPIPAVDGEIKHMGGFAWTEDGIRVALSGQTDDLLSDLRDLREGVTGQTKVDPKGNVARG